jgi:hypothetical protein
MRWKIEQLNPKQRKMVANALSLPPARTPDTPDRTSTAAAHMEQTACHEPLGEKEAPGYASPCHIVVSCLRKKLADVDGVSVKAALDGLVHSGLLADDKAEIVQSVFVRQAKAQEESTVIEVYEAL